MKIHLISDLHCDFKRYTHEFPECDIVVIAGDIGESPQYLIDICDYNPTHQIIFVPGNHCFYGASIESRMKIFKAIQNDVCKNLLVLNNESVEIDGVAFFGSTLWSGLDAYPTWKSKMKEWYAYHISDIRYINGWSPDMMLYEHKQSLTYLEEFLGTDDVKKVVITHFAPSLHSVHERFKTEVPFNAYWCNNLPQELIVKADLFLHGHVHNNFDYVLRPYDSQESCRVVCNPRGYVTQYGNENPEFNPDLILEI